MRVCVLEVSGVGSGVGEISVVSPFRDWNQMLQTEKFQFRMSPLDTWKSTKWQLSDTVFELNHVFSYFPLGFEGRMWDLIVSVPDHCLSFYSWQTQQNDCPPSEHSEQPGHLPSLIRVLACTEWVAKDPSFLHANSEDSDQTESSLGVNAILLVLSWRGSFLSISGIIGRSNVSEVQVSPGQTRNMLSGVYTCGFCGRSFGSNWKLETHYRTHTGDKPYRCEICGKSFTQKGNMRAHILIHMN